MIKTTRILKEELRQYVNPTAKISRLVKAGELIPIIHGLYETDPGIPEAVYTFTSATFEKKRTKIYTTPYGTFTYRDVPREVYPLGLTLQSDHGYGFFLASPEKAIFDQLYKTSPRGNRTDLEALLFEDLRIDEDQFSRLNHSDFFEISSHYKTKNHKLLQSYLRRRFKQPMQAEDGVSPGNI